MTVVIKHPVDVVGDLLGAPLTVCIINGRELQSLTVGAHVAWKSAAASLNLREVSAIAGDHSRPLAPSDIPIVSN